MLLLMLEAGMPIDCVITADTGMEFPEMYRQWDKIDQLLYQERGIHLTILRHPKGFEWLMFDQPKEKPSTLASREALGVTPYGNGWPGIRVRWCTGQLKTHLIQKEVNRIKGAYTVFYVLRVPQIANAGSFSMEHVKRKGYEKDVPCLHFANKL